MSLRVGLQIPRYHKFQGPEARSYNKLLTVSPDGQYSIAGSLGAYPHMGGPSVPKGLRVEAISGI
jgi:hypothetical protein